MFNFLRRKSAEHNFFASHTIPNKVLRRTPDLLELGKFEWQLMFVCDDLMVNRSHHKLMDGSQRLATAFTADDDFTMWKKRLGKESFPIPLKGYKWSEKQLVETATNVGFRLSMMDLNATRTGRIKGELFKVRPQKFIDLDNYRQNGIQFLRQRVDLYIPYRLQESGTTVSDEEFVNKVSAWMYIGILDYWEDLVRYGMNEEKTHIPATGFSGLVRSAGKTVVTRSQMFSRVNDFTAKRQISDGVKLKNYYFYTQMEEKDI